MAAALYPELPPLASVTDPFVDHAGLNHSAANLRASSQNNAGLVNTAGPLVPVLPDRNARLSQWQQSVRAAVKSGLALPPMTNAYLISELAPTGKFEMGGHEGVWLYLESERRTIAADMGAKFYDGILVGVTSEGAQFRTSLGHTKLVPWSSKGDSNATAFPPTIDNNPSQQQPIVRPAKPVSENAAPKAIPQAAPQGDYADLQEAVRDRYAQPATAPRTRAASPKPQPQVSPIAFPSSDAKPTATPIPVTDQEILEDKTSTPDQSRDLRFNHVAAFKAEPQATASPSPTPSPSASPASSPTSSAQAQAPEKVASQAPAEKAASAPSPAAIAAAPKLSEQRNRICDPSYRGERISTINESDRPMSLLTLVNQWNKTYGANIVLDYDIQETPIRLTVSDTPWTSVLRTILDLNDLDTVCLDGGIVQIAKRAKIAQISDQRRKSAPIVREVFKLRYLQPTAGARTNLAGQTQGTNGANIQTLEDAIREILKAGGDSRGEARRVPGHNELFVAATQQQMDEIRDLIFRVDRPGYQVKITALVYTTNDNRLRDIGSQLSVSAFSLNNNNIGGLSTLPNATTQGSSSGSGTGTGQQGSSGRNPGGIPGLLSGMRQPTNGLGAASPLVTLGGGMLFPSGQFAVQITAAQQQGAVNIQSRTGGIVADGETLDLTRGIQIPVVTTTIAGGAPFQSGQVQFIEASKLTQIIPQVAEDDQGRPSFVTLNLRLEDNSVDTSLGTFNGVPGVNRQSLQTVLRLKNGETAVIGGLAADQVSNSKSKVPGLGDLPVVGNLFKRKQKQETRDRLYFAITVEVIPQDAAIPGFQAPADATTNLPQPPSPQKPGPYKPDHK